MAAIAKMERRGIAKRRSWGKHRNRDKLISIDHMDISVLTKIENKDNKLRSKCVSNIQEVQHPELMSSQRLIDHLSKMKVVIPDGESSRDKLLYLFQKHVSPKPQRSMFWRRRRRTTEPMEVENSRDTGTDSSKSWDSPISRKRKHSEDDSLATPTHVLEDDTVVKDGANKSVASDDQVKASTGTTTKKIIKIRRK